MKLKQFSKLFAPAFIAAFSFCSVATAYGQTDPVATKSEITELPIVNKPVPKPVPKPSPTQIPENPRERRALAYAKLLEGQRYMITLTRGVSANSMIPILNASKAAFQQAATLEPKLGEAYTALAELAIRFPPYDVDEAIRYANKAIEADKNNFGSHRLLSRIYTDRSDLKKTPDSKYIALAIQELREVARLDSTDAEAWAVLSTLYLIQKRDKDAIEALKNWASASETYDTRFYEQVIGGNLTSDAAYSRLAVMYLEKGKTPEAIEAISRAIALNPDEENYIEILVEALDESEGGQSLSITEIKKLVTSFPTNLRLVRLLAETQSRAGKIDDAVVTLKNGIARLSDDDESSEALTLQMSLAEIYINALREKEAITVYESILLKRSLVDKKQLDEEERLTATLVLSEIIALQKQLGNFSDAEATIKRMRKVLGPDDTTADEENIELLRDQGKRNEALTAIKSLRQNRPSELSLVLKEAEILTELNSIDEAATLIRSKLSTAKGGNNSHDTDIQLYLSLSGLYSQANRGKDAVDAAQQGLVLVQKDNQRLLHTVMTVLASAQEANGDFKAAESTLRKILSESPNSATVLNNLGYFLVDRNDRVKEGFDMIQRAVHMEPANSSFLDSLGWAYFRLGKFTDAERYLIEAARRNPFSATIQDHLGDVYQKLGKTEPARTAWQQALKLSTDKEEQAKIKAKLNAKTLGAK